MKAIDKNIPMPDSVRDTKRKYPWADLDIGDSFVCEAKSIRTAYALIYQRKARVGHTGHDYKAAVHNGEIRIWRIA